MFWIKNENGILCDANKFTEIRIEHDEIGFSIEGRNDNPRRISTLARFDEDIKQACFVMNELFRSIRANEQGFDVKEAVDYYKTLASEMEQKFSLPYELPQPVKRDKNNKLIADYTYRDWFAKIAEETFEAHSEIIEIKNDRIAEEIADIITVCISYLDVLGYNEKARAELFHKVNEKNRDRGYLEE